MKTLTRLLARCGRFPAASLSGLRLRHATALATAILGLLAAPAACAGDCGTSLTVDSYTEYFSSATDTLQTLIPDMPGPLGPWTPNPLKIPATIYKVASIIDAVNNGCVAVEFFQGGVTFKAGNGADPNVQGEVSFAYDISASAAAGAVAGMPFDADVNGVKDIFTPEFKPCGEHPILRVAHFGGDMSGYLFDFGAGVYPRRTSKGQFHLCRDFVVQNGSPSPIEIPLTVSGSLLIGGGIAADDAGGKKNYAKTRLKISGSVGGESISEKLELESSGPYLAADQEKSINTTRRVTIAPGTTAQTVHVELDCEGYLQIQAHSSALFGLIAGAVTAQVSFPNSIDIGWPTGPAGSALPANVRIYDAADGSVYVDTTAHPVAVVPVPGQTPIWFFDQPFDSWLGQLLPANYTATAYGDTTVLSPPGMTAGLVRRADADADPLANVTNHNAFRLSFTVADTNTTPAVTVFIYDQPGGTPHALAYDLPLTPGYHEATLRYASGDASGRGVFTPGGPDLTRLHSIGIANTLVTNWPAQSALVTTGQLAVTFHHLAAFTAPPPGYEGFAITNSFLDTNRLLHLQYPASTNDYYLLYWGSQVTAVTNPIVMALGVDGAGEFFLTNLFATAFFQLLEVPLAQPLDVDGDGVDDVTEFLNPAIYNPFVAATPIITNQPPLNPGTNAPSNSGQIYLWTLNNHRYLPVAVTNGVTWDEANAAATAVGGHLATLTSAAENDFVFGLIDRPEYWMAWPTNPPAASGPWLGGWQPAGAAEPAGGWRWLTPEPFDFTAWMPGAPDNAASPFGANEDRLAFASAAANTRSNRWNDLPGALRLPGYVIEFDPPATSGDCIPRDGLVAWWKGDGNALDSAGTNDGVLMNGVNFAPSFSGQAFNFDGVSNSVLIASTPALTTSNFSWGAWASQTTPITGLDGAVVIFGQVGGPQLHFRAGTTGLIVTFDLLTTSGWSYLTNATEVPIGALTHVVGTWDGTTQKIYLNGVLGGAKTPSFRQMGQCSLYIGGFYGTEATCSAVAQFLHGTVDEVSLHNRALSADEIAGIYSGGITGRCKPQCVEPPAGLVAWWPGEGNANDIIGGNNGTLMGGGTYAPGLVGQAFNLDGTNSFVEVPRSPALNLTTNFTLALWFNQRTVRLPNGYRLIDTVEAGISGDNLLDTYDGVTGRRLRYGGNNTGGSGSTVYSLNTWHHAAVSFKDGVAIMYLDGRIDGIFSGGAPLTPSGLSLRIGAAHLGCGGNCGIKEFFDGLIDDVAIFNRALTAGEIASIYMAGSAGFCKNTECPKVPTDLVAWWPANGNANDIVGTNHGTLQGGATFASGKLGQAFLLDGVNDYLNAGQGLALNDMTLAAWVFIDAQRNTGERRVISKDDFEYGPTRKFFGLKSSSPWTSGSSGYQGRPAFGVGIGPSDDLGQNSPHVDVVQSPFPLADGWHHLAGVRQSSANRMEIWVDGVMTAQDANVTVQGAVDCSAPVILGRVSPTSSQPESFYGRIDEAMIFNRALTAGEIQALYQSVTLPAPLLGHWTAEGNAQSTTGNNHGTVAGGVTFASGVAGQAFNFNGVDGRVVVETPAGFPCASNWTLQVWAKPQLPQAAPALLAGQCLGPRLVLLPDGRVQAAYDTTDSTSVVATSTRALSPCRFSQVVAIYDAASLRLFLDGELDAVTPVAGKLAVITPCGFLIGGTDTNRFPCPCAQGFYHGLLDEVALYTRALFPAEVLANYTEFGPASSTPLLGHWPAEGNAQSTTAINHGTLASGVTFAPGVAGQAFNFNGVSGRVVVEQPVGFLCASNWTLQAWASPQLPQTAPALLAGQCLGPRLVLLPDGRVQAAYDAADQSSVSVISSRALLPCQFSQVVSIYDGESLRLYLNGQLDAATAVAGKLAVVTECGFLMGGVDTNGFPCHCAQGFYSGLLDEVALYTRALVPAEVLANYSEFAPTNSTPPVIGPAVDHGGSNWTLTAGTVLGGTHTNIGEFVIPSGVTASVMPFDGTNGGWTEIRAQRIRVDGTLTATGKGYPGGGGGGGGGGADQYQPGRNGLGGAGYLGSSNGETGDDGGSTTGGGGGRGRPGLSSAYALFPGSGGSYGPGAADANAVNTGGNAQDGGYRASEANGDATTGEEVFIGCGGGGGGGGGGGHSLNCNSGGGGGGGGGAGGLGGGAVILRAVESLEISSSGAVYARGALGRNGTGGQAGQAYESTGNWQSPGGDGGNGASANGSNTGTGGAGGSKAQDVDGGKRLNWSGKGGTGGGGGAGAGGGILLRAPTVTVTGTINNSGGSSPNNGGTVKIYSTCGSSIVTNQITTGRLVTEGVSQGPGQPTAAVPYQSFNGAALQLYPWRGNRVALLTPTADLDPAVMQRIVSSFDRVYDYYHAVTGRTPQPARLLDGLSTIAVVPSTCGAGCAYLGSTGIEMLPEWFNTLYTGVRDRNQFDQVVFYEFGRNFWFYSPPLEYKAPENGGSVVTGYAVLMRFLAMEAVGASGGPFNGVPFSQFRQTVEGLVDTYTATPNLNWQNTLAIGLAPPNSMNLGGADLFASFVLRLRRDYGGEAFIRQLWPAAGNRPAASTTQQTVDNFIVAASVAADRNLADVFTGQWRWPLSAAARAELAVLFPTGG